jgi:eukaryotic-like serine/threonine-protein kinase
MHSMDESEAPRRRMLERVNLPDRYVLVRHVADGGMASVWCAEDRVLGRRVAIKVLSERFAGDDEAGRRFQREARTAARLSGHRNVITIYDVGEPRGADGGGPSQAFIVMEYLAGGTVADALRLGSISPGNAARWVHETAAALDYAHGQGVLHRDIKPANLLLDRDRVVHVADFGIAQLTTDDSLSLEGKLLGTAAYLAPERARGKATTDASDRYSLAVVAFELLTGQRPFSAERFAAQARQHIDVPAPPASRRNPALPPAVDDVLARGMAKDPAERWPSSQEFADALQSALAQSGGRAAARDRAARALRPIPTGVGRSGPSRRRPALSAAGAAAMAGADAAPDARAQPPAHAAPPSQAQPPAHAAPPAQATALAGGVPPSAEPPTNFTASSAAAEPPSGGQSPGKPGGSRRVPARALALAALAAAAVGVVLAAGAGQHGSSHHNTSSLQAKIPAHADQPATRTSAAKPKPARPHPKPKPKPKPKPEPQAVPTTTATATQPEHQVTATSVSQTTPPPTAETLDARGHELMLSGAYSEAIPVLRQALAAASPSSLTYAYALYDLGRSLRLAGDPKAAVSVLYQRLKIPNQTETVRLELQEALRAVGQQSVQNGGGVPGPSPSGGTGHSGQAPGQSGGAGLPGPGGHRGDQSDHGD